MRPGAHGRSPYPCLPTDPPTAASTSRPSPRRHPRARTPRTSWTARTDPPVAGQAGGSGDHPVAARGPCAAIASAESIAGNGGCRLTSGRSDKAMRGEGRLAGRVDAGVATDYPQGQHRRLSRPSRPGPPGTISSCPCSALTPSPILPIRSRSSAAVRSAKLPTRVWDPLRSPSRDRRRLRAGGLD